MGLRFGLREVSDPQFQLAYFMGLCQLGPKMKLPHSNGDIHIVVTPKSFLRAGQVHLVFT